MSEKCTHGYFTSQPCPWCLGREPSAWDDFVKVIGHGNGWLLRRGDRVCASCGGPRGAGWGAYAGDKESDPKDGAPMCYVCTIGDNTIDAIAQRDGHVAQRGVKKQRGSKP